MTEFADSVAGGCQEVTRDTGGKNKQQHREGDSDDSLASKLVRENPKAPRKKRPFGAMVLVFLTSEGRWTEKTTGRLGVLG